MADRTQALTARDVMSTELLTVREDMEIRNLAEFLIENEITGAPVLDHSGHLVGVVSFEDIAESEVSGTGREEGNEPPPFFVGRSGRNLSLEDLGEVRIRDEGLTVRDIMTPTLFTVPEDTPIQEIARTMLTGRIHRLLVTRNGKVVGIVTSLDLLKPLSGNASFQRNPPLP